MDTLGPAEEIGSGSLSVKMPNSGAAIGRTLVIVSGSGDVWQAEFLPGSGVTVQELDSDPSIAVSVLRFPNGTLVNNGSGVVTVTGLQGPQGIQGIQGIQGNQGPTGAAGPNLVSTTTATNLLGLLYGNGTNVVVANATNVNAALGYTAANDANVLHTTGNESKSSGFLGLNRTFVSGLPLAVQADATSKDGISLYNSAGTLVTDNGTDGSNNARLRLRDAASTQRLGLFTDGANPNIESSSATNGTLQARFTEPTGNNITISPRSIRSLAALGGANAYAEWGASVIVGGAGGAAFGSTGGTIAATGCGVSWAASGVLGFYTSNNTALVERARLTGGANGNLLINKTVDDGVNKLQVLGGVHIAMGAANTALTIQQSYNADGVVVNLAAIGTAFKANANNSQATPFVGSITGSETWTSSSPRATANFSILTGVDVPYVAGLVASATQITNVAGTYGGRAIGGLFTATTTALAAEGQAVCAVAGSARVVPIVAKLHASQMSDGFQVQNSAGTKVFSVDATGNVTGVSFTGEVSAANLTGLGTGWSAALAATYSAGGGSGDVVGPAVAVDNAIARFDTTTGKLIQSSAATVDDAGVIRTNIGTGVPNNPGVIVSASADTFGRIALGLNNGNPFLAFGSGAGARDVTLTRTGTSTVNLVSTNFTIGNAAFPLATAEFRQGTNDAITLNNTTSQALVFRDYTTGTARGAIQVNNSLGFEVRGSLGAVIGLGTQVSVTGVVNAPSGFQTGLAVLTDTSGVMSCRTSAVNAAYYGNSSAGASSQYIYFQQGGQNRFVLGPNSRVAIGPGNQSTTRAFSTHLNGADATYGTLLVTGAATTPGQLIRAETNAGVQVFAVDAAGNVTGTSFTGSVSAANLTGLGAGWSSALAAAYSPGGGGGGSGDALVANPLSQFAATTSVQLAGVITDETGSGQLVFGTQPIIDRPVLSPVTFATASAYVAASYTNALIPISDRANRLAYSDGSFIRWVSTGAKIAETPNHTITIVVNTSTTGDKNTNFRVPFACTITGWELVGNAVGNLTLDIWEAPYASLPPTVANTITGSAKPTLASSLKAASSTLTGWLTALAQGDYLDINVDATAGVSSATLTLFVDRA